MLTTRRSLIAAGAAAAALPCRPAWAQQIPTIRIGVLTDMSGPYRDLGGPLCVACVQQAADEFNALGRGFRVEVLAADHQNKADVGSAIAREWFDQQGVDAITDINNSAVALALTSICVAKDKAQLNTGAALSDLTGKACTPNLVHWTYDTWEQAHSTCTSMVREGGGDTWFFLTADYAFGHAMERDATRFVQEAGGKVLGSAAYPFPGTTDFSSFLVRAQASGAKVIGLCNAGADTVNCIKQAHEFGLSRGGVRLAGMIVYINDVHAMGLDTAQGLVLTETFYWDLNDRTRAFTARVRPRLGGIVPNMEQAGGYAGVLHYLKAAVEIGPQRAKASGRAAIETMKRLPVDDDCFGPGSIQADGQALHPAYLFEVKPPARNAQAWDYYDLRATTPADRAFRPLGESDCPLVKT